MKKASKTGKQELLIPLVDYQRIYRVICGVLDGRINAPQACIFFSIVGSAILEMKYKIKATPIAGFTAILVNRDADFAAYFGEINEGVVTSNEDRFHCWIDCDGMIIDFMSPLFQESIKIYGHEIRVPRKMFQKRVEHMAPSINHLHEEGDFYLLANPNLTMSVFNSFNNKLANGDLAQVCLDWFEKPPRALNNISMKDDLGNIHSLSLKGSPIEGVW